MSCRGEFETRPLKIKGEQEDRFETGPYAKDQIDLPAHLINKPISHSADAARNTYPTSHQSTQRKLKHK
jgi:hypothetical protein